MTSTESSIPAFILPLLKSIATQEGFQDYTLICDSSCNGGEGLMGIINRVIIKGLNTNDELSLIVKIPPSDEPDDELILLELVFAREIFAYTQFLPTIVEFQNQKGIPPDKGFFAFPKVYGTILNKTEHLYGLILEDLRTRNFKLTSDPETRSTDIDHAIIVIKELAKLHGISFALNDQKPEMFSQFKKLEEPLVKELSLNESMKFKFAAFDRVIKCLCPIAHEKAIVKMQELKDNYNQHIIDCVSSSNRKSVINHGDFWSNNIMFFHEKQENKLVPSKVYFIDWQFLRLASPILDLVFFIFNCTEKSLRDEYYETLLNIYHETLCETIREAGSNAQKLFTFEDLQDHLRKYGKFAILKAPSLLHFMTSDSADYFDIDKFPSHDHTNYSKNDHIFSTKIKNIINDLIDLNYI